MYVNVEKISISAEGSEIHSITSLAMTGLFSDEKHWKKHGSASFLDMHKLDISVIRSLMFSSGATEYFENRLNKFIESIDD